VLVKITQGLAFSTGNWAHNRATRDRAIGGPPPMKPNPKPIPLRTPQEAAEARAELEEQIRRRAYELYEQRGRVDGYALDDWLQAEAEVSDIRSKTTAA